MHPSFNILRVGKRFRMMNLGDEYDFIVMKVTTKGEYYVKDLYSLEEYILDDVLKYGVGKDFSLIELE